MGGGESLPCGAGCQRAKEEGVLVAREKRGGEEAHLLPGLGWLAAAGGEEKARGEKEWAGERGKLGFGWFPGASPFFFFSFYFIFANLFQREFLNINK